jgi:hypothetical protein
VKSTGIDEQIGIVIHICMKTSQGILLYSYLYLKLAKMPCFSYDLFCWGVCGGIQALAGVGKWQGKGKEDDYAPNNVHTCM